MGTDRGIVESIEENRLILDDYNYPDFDNPRMHEGETIDRRRGIENYQFVTSPTDADTDDDGLLDGLTLHIEINSMLYDSTYLETKDEILNNDNYDDIVNGFVQSDGLDADDFNKIKGIFKKLQYTKSLNPIKRYDMVNDKYYLTFYGEKEKGTSPIKPDSDRDHVIDGEDIRPTLEGRVKVDSTFSQLDYEGRLEIVDFIKEYFGYSTIHQFFGDYSNYLSCDGSLSPQNYNQLTFSSYSESDEVLLKRIDDIENNNNKEIPILISINGKDGSYDTYSIPFRDLYNGNGNQEFELSYSLPNKKYKYYDGEYFILSVNIYILKWIRINEDPYSDVWCTLDLDNGIDNHDLTDEEDDDDEEQRLMKSHDISLYDDRMIYDSSNIHWYDENWDDETGINIGGNIQLTGIAEYLSDEQHSSNNEDNPSKYDITVYLELEYNLPEG